MAIILPSCKRNNETEVFSDIEKSEIESFLSTFTVKPVLRDYLEDGSKD